MSAAASTPEAPNSFLHSFWKGLKRDWFIYALFVVMVMAVAGFFVSISGIAKTNSQNVQLRRLAECQNLYNEINNERTRQLADATDRERATEAAADAALFNAVEAVYKNSATTIKKDTFEALSKRLEEQKIARQMSDQERREHPVPPPPKALCGNVPN